MLGTKYDVNKVFYHKRSEGEKVQSSECLRESLIIFDQTPKAIYPGKGALNHPPAGQENKATLGLFEFDDVELNAMFLSILSRIVPRVALVNPHQLHALPSYFLHLFAQSTNLRTISFISGCHSQSQKVS